MSKATLRRYTNLAATLHLLQNKCLTLLNPDTWDDRNDAFFMSEYERQKGAQKVLALCFAEAPETYHHWRVFSHGSDGVCLEFDKAKLEAHLKSIDGVEFRAVEYKTIKDAKLEGIATDDLPFVKRHGYRDEKEFRAVYTDLQVARDFVLVPISLDCIDRVTLSPWMAEALAEAVKTTIRGLEDCATLKVYRTTLIENDKWMRLANPKSRQ
jgi:hypothetical protein